MRLNGRAFTARAAAFAAVALALGAPAAYASSVLSVDGTASPPADVAVAAPLVTGTVVGFLTDFAVPATCTSSTTGGYVKRGAAVVAGAKIGAITSMSLGGCTMTGLGYPVLISKAGATEWGIFATATPSSATAATVPVEIRNLQGSWTSTGARPYPCEVEFTGTIRGSFNQNTQVLSIAPATSSTYSMALTVLNGSGGPMPSGQGGCLGQMYTGDRMQMTGSFQLSTPGTGGIHF